MRSCEKRERERDKGGNIEKGSGIKDTIAQPAPAQAEERVKGNEKDLILIWIVDGISFYVSLIQRLEYWNLLLDWWIIPILDDT